MKRPIRISTAEKLQPSHFCGAFLAAEKVMEPFLLKASTLQNQRWQCYGQGL